MTSPGQGFYEKMGWSSSADPRKRQFEVKKGENDALKREILDIENKRVEEHRDLTSDVSVTTRASHLTLVAENSLDYPP